MDCRDGSEATDNRPEGPTKRGSKGITKGAAQKRKTKRDQRRGIERRKPIKGANGPRSEETLPEANQRGKCVVSRDQEQKPIQGASANGQVSYGLVTCCYSKISVKLEIKIKNEQSSY